MLAIYQSIATPFDPKKGHRKLIVRCFAVDAAGGRREVHRAELRIDGATQSFVFPPEVVLDNQKIVYEVEPEDVRKDARFNHPQGDWMK